MFFHGVSALFGMLLASQMPGRGNLQFEIPAGDGAVGGEAEQVGEGREVECVEQGLSVFFVEPGEVVFDVDQDNDGGIGGRLAVCQG